MLKGTHILVTGASSGIGRAVTLLLAHEEVNLHLVGRDAETLSELARQARSWGAQTQLYPLDLLGDDALRAFAESFTAPLGALIHSAGVVTLGTLKDAQIEDFDAQYRLNVRAPYLLTQLLLGRLEQAQGQVVFINSGAGLNAHAGWGQYAATKHALRAVADSLRAEVAGSGVRVVSVAHLALAPDLPTPRAGTDAAAASWVPVSSGGSLAFDHDEVLRDGLERARAKLEYTPLATAFVREEFTVGELRRVYEAVWGHALDPRNFHRKVTGTPDFLLPVGHPAPVGPEGGRPAALFRRGPATALRPAMLRPSA